MEQFETEYTKVITHLKKHYLLDAKYSIKNIISTFQEIEESIGLVMENGEDL
jgi:hypothetical protein